MKVNHLLILATDGNSAYATAQDKWDNFRPNTFKVTEIEGPFRDGQILVDGGFHRPNEGF